MKCWHILLLAVSLGYSSWIAHTQSIEPTCHVGQTTQLAAQRCVNVWPADDAKFRWPDLRNQCDPKSPVCDSAQVIVSQSMQIKDCGDVRILSIRKSDHVAKVRCSVKSPDKTTDYLVNLDSLSCSPDNVSHYGPVPPASPPGISAEKGEALVSKAEEKMGEIRSEVANDTQVLLGLIEPIPPSTFAGRMRTAQGELGELLLRVQEKQHLDTVCEPLNPKVTETDNWVRAQRTCRLLRATVDNGLTLLDAAKASSLSMSGPDPDHWMGVALKKEVTRIASSSEGYDQAKALATRMLLFYALKGDNPSLPKQLKLIRRSVETGARDPLDAAKTYFYELHAGFVFGGRGLGSNSGGGYDCSDFMSSLLTSHGHTSGSISSFTLKNIAHHLAGEIPGSSLSPGAKELESCFEEVDVRAGKAPQAGDLVISNNEALKDGHVTIVKSYLGNGSILTIEDSGGGANTIMSKERPLFEPPPVCPTPEERQPMRPDLYVLRFKSPKPNSCPISIGLDRS